MADNQNFVTGDLKNIGHDHISQKGFILEFDHATDFKIISIIHSTVTGN